MPIPLAMLQRLEEALELDEIVQVLNRIISGKNRSDPAVLILQECAEKLLDLDAQRTNDRLWVEDDIAIKRSSGGVPQWMVRMAQA